MFLHGRSPNTVRSYETSLEDFRAFLGRPLATAGLGDVQRWDDLLAGRGMAAASRRHHLSAVRSFYDFAIRLGMLTADPTQALRSPKVPDTLANRVLSVGQVQALLAAARARIVQVPARPQWIRLDKVAALLGVSKSAPRNYARRYQWTKKRRPVRRRGVPVSFLFYDRDDVDRLVWQGRAVRDYALLVLLYESGCRITEVLSLRWRDIAAQEGGSAAMTVTGKGTKVRTVGLRPECVALLGLHRGGAPPSGLVFRAVESDYIVTDRPYQREHTCRFLHELAAEAGLGLAVSAHWLRHAHASHALDAGCPIHVVKEQLGHASLTATERYLHTRPGVTSAAFLPSMAPVKPKRERA